AKVYSPKTSELPVRIAINSIVGFACKLKSMFQTFSSKFPLFKFSFGLRMGRNRALTGDSAFKFAGIPNSFGKITIANSLTVGSVSNLGINFLRRGFRF
ncbi:unnamed protein product, partial [Sphenostylis stenocarpa]